MTLRERFSSRLAHVSLTLALASPATVALADETVDETAEDKKQWHVTVGAGVVNRPEYPGSGSDEIRPLPVLNVRYGRFFLGGVPGGASSAGLGAYLYEDKSWNLGAVVAGDVTSPRKESDDARLRGLGDIDATARAGMFGSYRIGWLTLRASALSDIGGNDQGTIASFDAEATFRPFPRLVLSAGPGVAWADEKYMQTFFGVDAGQAARSAFAPYTAGSGVGLVRFSFGAQYELTRHWGLGARVTAARLQGDAADSPIVEDRNQNSYALFASYRF